MIAAIYCRVSTEEQAKSGMSIQTQKQALEEYCNENKHTIYDYYIDDGISADKLDKRLALQKLLKDIKDHKIEMVLFTKIDRWFRSVEKYYKIQPILEENNVVWKAIFEDYSTIDANSRFKLNIMLSVAQQERERTSERIKDVFNYMTKNKIAFQSKVPIGFDVVKENGIRKIVHKDEEMVYDMIEYYKMYRSKQRTINYINEKYSKEYSAYSLDSLFHSSLLYGKYRDIENFCEPYISENEFNELQQMMKMMFPIRSTERIYTFSKLIKCPYCNYYLAGYTSKQVNNRTKYRCNYRNKVNNCEFDFSIKETKIEKELLNKINDFMKDYIIEMETKEKEVPKKIDYEKIEKQMNRLTDVYVLGRISQEEYERKYTELKKKLDFKPVVKDLKKVKELIDTDFLSLYNTLNGEEKRAFWHGLIKEIHLNYDGSVKEVVFL